MAAEELVEGVLAGDVEREALGPAARAAPHLPQARHRPRERDADRGVQVPDVDAELERVGRHDREQVPARQAGLDVAALLGRVAGPVGRDPLGELRAPQLLQPHPGEALDQLDAAPAAQEADGPHPLAHKVRQELRGLRQDRATGHRPRIDHRRVPHADAPGRAGRAIGVHEPEGLAHQALGELERVCDRRRGQHEARLGPVSVRDSPQAPQHVRDVRSEDAAVGVRLVHDDPPEVRDEVAPALVVGQDPDVEHVRVGEDQVRPAAYLRAVVAGRVAVIDRVAELA